MRLRGEFDTKGMFVTYMVYYTSYPINRWSKDRINEKVSSIFRKVRQKECSVPFAPPPDQACSVEFA